MNRASGVLELMDGAIDETEELAANLRDIALGNRWFGGIAPVRREVERARARTMLDIGSGLADVPYAIVRRARKRCVDLRATCLDRSGEMITLARAHVGDDPAMTFVQGEGERLPFADRSFDVVTCSLALHHFEPEAATALLAEMRRVARLTPIVADLMRSRTAYLGVYALTRVISRNRYTRHDGPLSVRRAYTPREALSLARAAGWRAPRVRREPFFRMTLIDG